MPLRDHLARSPRHRSSDRIHGGWPMVMAAGLNRRLPVRCIVGPRVHLRSTFEIDVATFDQPHDEVRTPQ